MSEQERIPLSDGSGRWFDANAATCYQDDTWWNGNNHIHRTTNDQWSGQWLYRTASGRWILHEWSARGGPETYESVDDEFAIRWLSANGHQPDIFADQINELEV